MKVIKRSGQEVNFDSKKIYNAILAANDNDINEIDRIPEEDIKKITNNVTSNLSKYNRTVTVEEIQDMVENQIISLGYTNHAKEYIKYRYKQSLKRQANSTDDYILSLIDGNNEDVNEENSNKNSVVVSVQRDYMAGEVSKDLTRRIFLPKKITEAHDRGIIHFHRGRYCGKI